MHSKAKSIWPTTLCLYSRPTKWHNKYACGKYILLRNLETRGFYHILRIFLKVQRTEYTSYHFWGWKTQPWWECYMLYTVYFKEHSGIKICSCYNLPTPSCVVTFRYNLEISHYLTYWGSSFKIISLIVLWEDRTKNCVSVWQMKK